jgi:hypothetical protein
MGSSRRRAAAPGIRARVPPRSRVTVRRTEAPLLRSASLSAALRQSRAALTSLEGELGALLEKLRDPAGRPDVGSADRLHGATSAAEAALASLRGLSRR